MLDIIKSIILGIIQGFTEWLPISSTGHMILADEFIKLQVSEEFFSVFLVVIQFASILAVILIFFKKLFPWGFNKTKAETKATFNLWIMILIGCLPAGVIGILFDEKIEALFFNPWTVAITLILYGIIFIVIETVNKTKAPKVQTISGITYRTALLIGVFQVLALIPGTSRSGATIIGGLLLGLDRKTAASYTFYLAVPVMAGASLLKLLKFGLSFSTTEIMILLAGMLSAFLVSVLAISFLLKYIKKHDFKVFGYYRIGLGIIVLLYFFLK